MNAIILGPPGSGKGTQGVRLAERLGVPKIATGDLIRAAMKDGTPLGIKAKQYYDQGLLVPDDIILELIAEVLALPEAAQGLVMDGFPRTVAQAEAVDALLAKRGTQVDRVIEFVVPEQELMDRMLKRAAVEGRADDTPETIRRRLEVYHEQTAPLVAFYEKRGLLTKIDAVGTVGEIAGRVSEVLGG